MKSEYFLVHNYIGKHERHTRTLLISGFIQVERQAESKLAISRLYAEEMTGVTAQIIRKDDTRTSTREINVNNYIIPTNRDMHFISGDQKLCITVFIC